ncbi:hypothetical protein M422DRAFT_23496 [Sphaerobolus stellatus SS14]|nr:hypothetical protein M422DRAFT_23496 [Sphaerobolus stellatus SS14]
MVIQVGSTFPSYTFSYVPYTDELADHAVCGKPQKLSTDEWKGKKVVLVSVPGAFTPGCHMTHVPGYVKQVKDLKAKGVDVVAFMAVNDPFVMSAWGRVVGAKEDLIFLSDPAATLSTQLGLSVDRSAQGLGIRGARYALLLDDLVVKYVGVDEAGKIEKSTAETVLKLL